MPQTGQGKAHLVGSINLESAEDVFRQTAAHMGSVVKRMPDGETGYRLVFTASRARHISEHPDFEPSDPGPARTLNGPQFTRYKVREGRSASDVVFDSLGYADDGLASYETFRRLKNEGVIAGDVRFQVSLPTPPPVTALLIDPPDQLALEPTIIQALKNDAATLAAKIPHRDLAIQWDIAPEIVWLETKGDFPLLPPYWDNEDLLDGTIRRAADLGDSIPADVDLGYHLCYGDSGGVHAVEPSDASHLVSVANRLSENVSRGLQFIQMPVPIERDDDAYFEPLKELKLRDETELYLGLLHREDMREGAERRIAAAQRYIQGFGVATECGMGREKRDVILPLMDLHNEVAQSLAVSVSVA